jgi:hypothetical protein
MKKLLVVMFMLAMACTANAIMVLSIPNTGTEVAVDADVTIDALTSPFDEAIPQSAYMLGITTDSVGGGTFNVDNVIIEYLGVPSVVYLDSEFADLLGLLGDYVRMDLSDNVGSIDLVVGDLVSGIKLTIVTYGLVVLRLFDGDGIQHGSDYEITVSPEPITIGLLGLGALFLRRRK